MKKTFIDCHNSYVLAGALVSVPDGVRAQQSSVSDQQLSERLLDAVDGNDVETVRSILAIALDVF